MSYCFYLVHEMAIVNVRAYVFGPPAVPLDPVGAAAVRHELIEVTFRRRRHSAGSLRVATAASYRRAPDEAVVSG